MKRVFIFIASWVCILLCASAKGAIAYFSGPAFDISLEPGVIESIDFDQNDIAEFSFFSGISLSTGYPDDVTTPVYVSSLGSNSLLCNHAQAAVIPAGTIISSVAISNSVWTNTDGAGLAEFFRTGQTVIITPQGLVTNPPSSGWGGSLAAAGDGFLGVRFLAEDGLHYGWIHASIKSVPTILDWAYETQPGTAIAAGAAPLAGLKTPQIVRPGNLRLEWQSQPGAAYQVQFRSNLGTLSWRSVGFTIIATANSAAVDVPLTENTGFYRVAQAN
jgi:hypothetical protein